VSFLGACSSKAIKEESKVAPPPVATVQAPQAAEPAPAQSASMSEKKTVVNPLTDPNNILSKRSIYFDFDKYEVKAEFSSLVQAHVQYLKDHPQASLTIEGNADERGSREYNLALGQKRAAAVKKVMNAFGATDKQIETISYGKEKPKALGHDGAALAENRRADIKYTGE
jgi:peptidoglycan-associated lipoprotein